jgi:Uma2 family endonuclease
MNTPAPIEPERKPLTLHFGSLLQKMDAHEFFEFCQRNRDWRFERTGEGDLIVMPPTGGKTGHANFNLTVLFGIWARNDGSGIGFDSSTGFTLPNGAQRSPDMAWIPRSRWEALTEEERVEFPPLCPDFVVEIRSASDALLPLQRKMQEYLDNGVQLGWLIDPLEKKVYVYQPQAPVLCLDHPTLLSGEPVLPGFVLHLDEVWE